LKSLFLFHIYVRLYSNKFFIFFNFIADLLLDGEGGGELNLKKMNFCKKKKLVKIH